MSKGISVIAITDHNTIDGARKVKEIANSRGDMPDVQVIVGEEVSSSAGHIAGLFLERAIPRGLDPATVIKEIHNQNGIAVIPHPLASMPKSLNLETIDQLVNHADPKCRPDVIEVLNGFPWQVRRYAQLMSLNNEFCLAISGGSDSHGPSSLGCVYTEFEGVTASDLRKALELKKTTVHGGRWPLLELARALGSDTVYRSKKLIRRYRSSHQRSK